MESLRWILILAGVAILVLLYVSGRPRAVSRTVEPRDSAGRRTPDTANSIPNPMTSDNVPAPLPNSHRRLAAIPHILHRRRMILTLIWPVRRRLMSYRCNRVIVLLTASALLFRKK